MTTQREYVLSRVKAPVAKPTTCHCCGSPDVHLCTKSRASLMSSRQWPLYWECRECKAQVTCHRGTDMPLGRMADRPTRQARFNLHRVFDKLWKDGYMTRDEAYNWLANMLQITTASCHISWFDIEYCNKAIEVSKQKLDTLVKTGSRGSRNAYRARRKNAKTHKRPTRK